jgi:tyrosinase
MPNFRKNVKDLTEAEKSAFVKAVKQLKVKVNEKRIPLWDELVAIHAAIMDIFMDHNFRFDLLFFFFLKCRSKRVLMGHRTPSFLPWHRYFILSLEKMLQDVDPSVTVPYWYFFF